ncbi:MAG: hypothetical protein R3B95_10080 [Nitrospirales bacterium]|nr:hypothetical protein [Nitrospirales bacterium]
MSRISRHFPRGKLTYFGNGQTREFSREVIPNGVDSEYFSLAPGVQRTKSIIVFTAAMDYFPNIDGAVFFARKFFHEFIKPFLTPSFLLLVGIRCPLCDE